MRAIVIKQYGGPEVLALEERPDPEPQSGHVLIEVKAFGLNHAEIYFRKGVWGDVAEVTGIECAGIVKADPDGRFAPGQKVIAIVGGMGRSFNGSYAELLQITARELNLGYIGRKEVKKALDDAAIAHQVVYDTSPENPKNKK